MKRQLTDLQLEGKKVLMRCDFNVPLDENLEITDDIRIRSAMESINYVLDNGGSLILMSHMGRPKGEAKKEFSLKPVAERLADLLGKEVVFADFDDVMNNEVKEMADRLIPGEVLLLQNTRYRKEEKKNDDGFSKELASLGDVFVNDAFGTAHRAHASNVGVTKYLPSAVGFLIGKEIEAIGGALSNPQRPLTAILGGAKVSDKIGVIENLMNVADNIIIGGGMAFTFVKAQGYEVGSSLLEADKVDLAAQLVKKADEKGVKLILPVDYKIAREFKDTDEFETVDWRNILEGHMGLDIGTKSIKIFSDTIRESKTVIWNGPMGVFEFKNFAISSSELKTSQSGRISSCCSAGSIREIKRS